MTAQEKIDFLKNNKDLFDDLSKIIWRETNIKSVDKKGKSADEIAIDILARDKARGIVEEWIGKTFTDAYAVDVEYKSEEDSIYNYFDQELSGNTNTKRDW